jgi:hypothetical protein
LTHKRHSAAQSVASFKCHNDTIAGLRSENESLRLDVGLANDAAVPVVLVAQVVGELSAAGHQRWQAIELALQPVVLDR